MIILCNFYEFLLITKKIMEILWNYINNLCTFLTVDLILFSSFCDNLFYKENFNSVTLQNQNTVVFFLIVTLKQMYVLYQTLKAKQQQKFCSVFLPNVNFIGLQITNQINCVLFYLLEFHKQVTFNKKLKGCYLDR